MRGSLVVFAKWPTPGEVKTRLCPPLAPDEAAELYGAMLDDVLELTARVAPALGLAPALAAWPEASVPDFAARAPSFRVFAQEGRDLAARMEHAAAQELARGAAAVLLRGSDSPALGADALADALAALARVDVALSPDPDGGYNLVALRRFAPGLFAHPMSTSRVLEDTRAAATRLGLTSALLAPGFDVDVAADFARLREAPTERCPRSLAWLAAFERRARERAR